MTNRTGPALLGFGIAASLLGVAAIAARPNAAEPPKLESEVVFASYGGSFETFMRRDVMPEFEKATGVKVKLVVGNALGNFATVQATKDHPEIDVYWSNELTHIAGKLAGLYEKLDPAVVTNLADVYEFARDPDGIGVAGQIMATGIEYNAKAFKEAGIAPPQSWLDLLDPRMKGRLYLYNFNVSYSQDFLPILARVLGADEKNVRPAFDKLKQARAQGIIAGFVGSSPAQMDNVFSQGAVTLTVNGGARAYQLKDKGLPIEFVYPKEGAGLQATHYEVIKNAPHPRAAQALVNHLISASVQRADVEVNVSGPVNAKVVVPESRKGQVPAGDMLKSMIQIDRVEMNKQLDGWTETWNREVETGR